MTRRPFNPAEIAAELLAGLPASQRSSALATLKGHDPKLAQQVEESLFTFDKLAALDDHSWQRLLREIPLEEWAAALNGAQPPLQERVLANLSRRLAEQLREDMASRDATTQAVDAAQRHILKLARHLAAEGKIALGGEDEWVE
ncbi:MAG: FliG C-terminal domain-containing protein [Sulfuricellaceae bacterium]|jgi:flagellar motor switch protein FliG